MVAGCGVPSAGVAGGRGGCPRPLGGFADDEASTACARCRLSRRYGGRCRLLRKRVGSGFLGVARRVAPARWEACGASGTGALALRRISFR